MTPVGTQGRRLRRNGGADRKYGRDRNRYSSTLHLDVLCLCALVQSGGRREGRRPIEGGKSGTGKCAAND
jgi:hypothetical protein